MKKIVLLCFICIFISCKKKETVHNDDLTKVKWVLETATVNPKVMVNGSLSNDYKNAGGPGSCLSSDYTLTFLSNGTYQFSSTGALCDMVANINDQVWRRDGSSVILKQKNIDIIATVNGDTLTYTISNSIGIVYWQYVYTFKSKPK